MSEAPSSSPPPEASPPPEVAQPPEVAPPVPAGAEAYVPSWQVRRFRLTVAYDGTYFHGWQKQTPPGKEPLRTVQGTMERAVAELLRQRVNVVGASRTDAGVHARGQVAQFDAACPVPITRLAEALNTHLPQDVAVLEAVHAAGDFDAIGGATWKQYRYRFFLSRQKPLDRRNYTFHCWLDLDPERMAAAGRRLIGTHDFAGLSAADRRLSTVRTIFDCRIEPAGDGSPEVHMVVQGSGFLYNMVRIIAGTLMEVGRGKMEPEHIDAILAGRDRRLAGPTLPANGLWLEWIRYDAPPALPSVATAPAAPVAGSAPPPAGPQAPEAAPPPCPTTADCEHRSQSRHPN